MKVILFGASGMVGRGVLRECLQDPYVETVLLVGRNSWGRQAAKLQQMVVGNPGNLAGVEDKLTGFDACFFCLGVSSMGMSEADYKAITYDLTIGAARTLARLNPGMTFIYVSGMGTDSSEKGGTMWARVKGATENELLRMPFKAAYMFRPGGIQPMHGEQPRAKITRFALAIMAPFIPLLIRLGPKYITTTERMGRAMLIAAKTGAPKKVLESADINALSSGYVQPR